MGPIPPPSPGPACSHPQKARRLSGPRSPVGGALASRLATDRFERLWAGDWKSAAEAATHGQVASPNWAESQAVFKARVGKAQEQTAPGQADTVRLTARVATATIALAVATIVLALATIALVFVTADRNDHDDTGNAVIQTP